MVFNVDQEVQIASRHAVRSGLACAGDPQPRSGIHARRNPQLDGLFALEASLAAALLATLSDNLSRALARWARARNGKESLLIGQLAAAGAALASLDARALLCACPVARLAIFLPQQLELGGH